MGKLRLLRKLSTGSIAALVVASCGSLSAGPTRGYLPSMGPPPLRFAKPAPKTVTSEIPTPEMLGPWPQPASAEPSVATAPSPAPTEKPVEALTPPAKAQDEPPEVTVVPDELSPVETGTNNAVTNTPVMNMPPPPSPVNPETLVELLQQLSQRASTAPLQAPAFIPPIAPQYFPQSRATYQTPPATKP
jgi:hypothetical protein